MEIVHTFKWTFFKPWCIYDYKVLYQNVNQGYYGTEYGGKTHSLLLFIQTVSQARISWKGGSGTPPPPPLVYLNFLNLHSKIIENGSRIPLKIIDIPRTHPPPPPSGKNFCIRACHVHVLVVYSLSLLW